MKNKQNIIFTVIATFSVAGNAFAGYIWPTTMVHPTRAGAHSTTVLSGAAYSNKEGGVPTQTILGEVKSVNADKGVFVVEDRHDGITATVSTDSQTLASLHPEQMVTVKLRSGSPFAQSVMTESSGKNSIAAAGMTYYGKEGGIAIKTIVGMIESVNPGKNVFVIKGEGAPTTVLTDSETIAPLRQGQTASVKLHSGSPFAVSVAVGR